MSGNHTMRALVLSEENGPLQLTEIARPEPRAGEALVRIHASGVNPLDTKIRAGRGGHAKNPLPAVLGMDLTGVVESVGPGVDDFQIGDEVYGMTGGVAGIPGTLAEFAAVDARLLARKPANLTMREAAALPLVFITAWEGVVDQAHVQAGQKVLIHGGAGGVGHVAVQLARALGAEVFATVSPQKKEIAERFGATPIDYKAMSVEEYVTVYTDGEGFDVVYDTVGGTTLDDTFRAVKTYTGHAVSCLGRGPYDLSPLSFRAATYSAVFTLLPLLTGKGRAHHGEILREATKLAEAGKLTPLLNERRFTMETAMDAHAEVEKGALGKVVVEIVG
ncbi:quinone oxidoreductase [Capsulimonas corticalis]|uniref:Quinone oxidoreductase n=1 Tax=Capsulimonas corticalis TaxID=2219043 RepID=A0A402D3F5_9BACT|nr:zinc-dependent alcohol dehydrogenase family protein [Capsulimonas corticalis]BDI28519.1 quinone oxidoreductase [Capsulimonas corticalis]